MDCEKHSLMDKGDGYPMSRDHGYTNFKCKQRTCMSNYSGSCISPSRCIIGEDGKCEGFIAQVKPL